MSEKRDYKRYMAIGISLLIVGFVFWLYPITTLNGIATKLDDLKMRENLTEAEIKLQRDLQYSRSYWELMQVTMLNPVSSMLFAVGIILIIYSLALRFV